ncbi:hypothetical protein NM208_g4804 [Fusarium decemcellulare]|uniref:Uncharacterized protein n=1 Tax=Fusarium decemcellulare TaxID=57161 RepID=A0ACC1SJE6_9HYPO|nr:hypothetical protein NM208_g4804 [Fusarium decemcellulare]
MANVTNTTCANSLVDLGQQQLEKGSSSEEEGTDVSAQVAPDTWTKRSEEKKQLELDDMKKSPFDHKEPNVAPPFLHDMGSIEDKPNGLPTVVKKGPELWVKAEEILSEESQAWFAQLLSDETQCASRGPTEGPEHHRIIELTKRKQAECEAQNSKLTLKLGNRKLELGKYFGSMIKWLDQFKNIGDMAVAYDPVHAALPWAALRFILQAMVAEQEHMESTLRILATTPRLLFSGRILEAVYLQETTPASEGGRNQVLYQESVRHLQEDLISLYAGILSALEYCYVMFSKKKVHRRIVAIFNSSEPTDIIKELKALETNVTARAEACGRLCSHRLSAHSTNLLQQLDTSLTNINDQMFEVMTRMKAEDKKMILKSISEVPFITHHRTIREERVDGTCGWILEKEEFRKWEDSGTALAILYGSPGSGKTFVISKLIDYTFENAKSEDAVAFFYCSREENSRREPESIFRSLLRQLSSAHDERDLIHRLLQDRAVELVEGTATLSARECSDLIPKMLDDYSSTTIIIDALDECDRVTRHTLMNGLDRLIEQRKRLKIFISSRRDDDIQFHFRFRPIIELKATDNENDLTHFVNSRLSQNEHWKKLSDPLQAMVREKLRHGAGDMFQWAALQLHHLFQLRLWTEQNIEEQLAKFPSDLKGAYDLAWEKIEMMSQYEQKCSKRAFMWILCSAGRLNTRALSMAMLLDPESDTVDDLSSELEEREISGLSENLLVYDKQSDHWRFCHLSAREYFERHHCNTDDANSFVVMGCLKFLLVDPCREEKTACECSKQATSIPSDSTKPFPFPCAALRIHVFEYIKRLEKITTPNDARIELLLKRFLGSPQSSSLAYQDWAQRCGGASRIDNSVLRPFSSPLIAMSVFGVFERLRDWWEESKTNLDLANDQGMQLLDLAKAYHQGDIQEFIVRHIPRGIKPDGATMEAGLEGQIARRLLGVPKRAELCPKGRWSASFLLSID